MVSGDVVNEPDPNHTCAGFTADGTPVFDHVQLEAVVRTPDGEAPVTGVNRERRADELIVYRPSFDQTTGTNAFGAEAVVRGGVVIQQADLRGNSLTPPDGFVLSGHGRARSWIMQTLTPGTPVLVRMRFVPRSADARWDRVVHAIGGGPHLLAGGLVSDEGFASTLVGRRHPRTALGVLPDGRIILLVVDGRSPPHSLGMTLVELALEMRRLGAVDAMNLDGGGSATPAAAKPRTFVLDGRWGGGRCSRSPWHIRGGRASRRTRARASPASATTRARADLPFLWETSGL